MTFYSRSYSSSTAWAAVTYPRLTKLISTEDQLMNIFICHPRICRLHFEPQFLKDLCSRGVVYIDAMGDVSRAREGTLSYDQQLAKRIYETPDQIKSRLERTAIARRKGGIAQSDFLREQARKRTTSTEKMLVEVIKKHPLILQCEFVTLKEEHGLNQSYCHIKLQVMEKKGVITRISARSDHPLAKQLQAMGDLDKMKRRSFILDVS